MKRNRWLYLSLLLIAMTLLSGACNREATGAVSGTPSANGTGTPDATGVAGATATPAVNYSPRTLPVREITFRVRVPANTPSNDTVYVIVLPFNDGWTQHVALTRESGNVWSGVVSLPIDSMVRYAYDRWPDENDFVNTRTTREAADEVIEVDSRYMHLTSDVSVVEDVVDTWRDRPAPSPSGIITGVVLDATTGEPVMDANVSFGGIHMASDWDGRFRFEGLVAGRHRVVVRTTLGDYKPRTAFVEVPADGVGEVEVRLEPAKPVKVTFEVSVPEDTPENAEIRLFGSVAQLGSRPSHVPNSPSGDNIYFVTLERVKPGRAVGVVELYEGMYVQYVYSILSTYEGREQRLQNFGEAYRDFVVSSADEQQRTDQVEAWRHEGIVQITVRVAVPPNTNPDDALFLITGPAHSMIRTGPREWEAYVTRLPNSEFSYRYNLGDDFQGGDGSPETDENGTRTIVVQDRDVVVEDRIDRWEWSPRVVVPQQGEPAEVTIRVSVPPSTPAGSTIRLTGDDPALASGVVMRQVRGNRWLYEATVAMAGTGTLRYGFDRGTSATASTRTHSVEVRYTPRVVNDWVVAWSDAPTQDLGTHPDFIRGMYTPDYWNPNFIGQSVPTFTHMREFGGEWVVVSSVWHYGQFDPPVVESRRVRAPGVLTPRTEIMAQAKIAHDMGLKVILGPQFNMEMVEGGLEAVCASQTDAWWAAFLREAERLWMWNAIVAQEIGAEALVLPGNCYHVFAPKSFFETQEYADEFDLGVIALIEKVRTVYDGKLIISGGVLDYEFPGHADYVGVTSFDTGFGDLSYDATVEDWRAMFEATLVAEVDPKFERWGKPVFYYTVETRKNYTDPGDPTLEIVQANQIEGFFQAIQGRPWIGGSLTWAYFMVDSPLFFDSGVRGRMAEAVLAKYYEMFTGGN